MVSLCNLRPSLVAGVPGLARTNVIRTILGVKRIIGRRFDEPSVQRDIQQWPFKVVAGAGKQPRVEVQYNGETKKFDIEEISEMVSQSSNIFVQEILLTSAEARSSNPTKYVESLHILCQNVPLC